MDFIAFVGPTVNHAPYPGVKVTAIDQATAVAAAAALLGITAGQKFFVVPIEAFTINCFTSTFSATTAPPYV